MKTIYKYPLTVTKEQSLTLPIGAQILSVIEQGNSIVLYAMIETDEFITQPFWIGIYGTGFDNTHLDRRPHARFLGTVPLNDGDFMCHVFVDYA